MTNHPGTRSPPPPSSNPALSIGSGLQIPVQVGDRRHRETTFVQATQGFYVTPRSQGDGSIRVDLEPVFQRVQPGTVVSGSRGTMTVTVDADADAPTFMRGVVHDHTRTGRCDQPQGLVEL